MNATFEQDYIQAAAALDDGPAEVRALREAGLTQFRDVGFPHTKLEPWRFTDVRAIAQTQFQPASAEPMLDAAPPWWWSSLENAIFLTLRNGRLSPDPRLPDMLPTGVSLSRAGGTNGTAAGAEDLAVLGSVANVELSPFTALNSALVDDALVLRIAPNIEVPTAIHIHHRGVSNGVPLHVQPRFAVDVGENASVCIIESFTSNDGNPFFVNAVAEFVVGPGATVNHIRLQDEGASTYHVGGTYVRQSRDSRFLSHALNLGGRIGRNDIQVWLDGEGSDCMLNGLYLGVDQQVLDTHSVIHHTKPNCTSHELYKGILDDKSRGVFSGLIHVYQEAQKTDSFQTNRALLLSDDARVNAKPQLLIFADDVKCSHGATVGQLDEEALFYLQTRGIDLQTARGILTVAFAAEAFARLPIPELREALDHMLLQRFSEE